MGLFKKELCDECGEPYSLAAAKYIDGKICRSCYKKCGYFAPSQKGSIKNVRAAMDLNSKNQDLVDNFKETASEDKHIRIDDINKKWIVCFKKAFVNFHVVMDYKDLISFELLEDGDTITKGGLGGAIVGGLLFGGLGATIGGITGKRKNKQVINSLKIKITVAKFDDPVTYIELITSETKASSFIYKFAYNSAQKILSLLELIARQNEHSPSKTTISSADEIMKFKSLLDQGVITEDEFKEKKKQLLGI